MASPEQTYRTAEFAALAGVTVRALYHYDRLGLLRPRRSAAGYRVYTTRDLEGLEQIVALKFIGVPLKRIARLRRAGGAALVDALRAQRETMEEKSRGLRRAIDAIAEAEAALRAGRPPDASLFRTIIGAIEMQQDDQEWTRQYRERLDAKIATLRALPEDTRVALRQQWRALVDDIRRSRDEDPAGPRAQALASRWRELLQQISGAIDPSWTAFLESPEQRANAARYAATLARPDAASGDAPWQQFVDPEVWDFIRRAIASRR